MIHRLVRLLVRLIVRGSVIDVVKQHGPDNPRDWDPNDPKLKSPVAPHETAGVLRMHRTGKSGPEILKTLKITGTKLMHQLNMALTAEQRAHAAGRVIHDALIKKGTK